MTLIAKRTKNLIAMTIPTSSFQDESTSGHDEGDMTTSQRVENNQMSWLLHKATLVVLKPIPF